VAKMVASDVELCRAFKLVDLFIPILVPFYVGDFDVAVMLYVVECVVDLNQ
jgi:hypothetical protein